MDTDMHVFWSLEAFVVELYICIEHLVGGLVVTLIGRPTFQHGLGAEIWFRG
jgi:hypothetical protein